MNLLFLTFLHTAQGYDPNTPHGHQGVLKPITSAPAAIALSADDKAQLNKGEVLLKSSRGDEGGRGVAIQYVKATESKVWDTILDYDQYPQRVSNVKSCEVYKRSGDQISVELISSIMGFSVGVYTVNTVKKSEGYMAWTLDYTRESDAYDMIGYWRVEQIQETPPLTKLEYSTEVQLRGVPGFVASYLSQGALKDGTQWVKTYSER